MFNKKADFVIGIIAGAVLQIILEPYVTNLLTAIHSLSTFDKIVLTVFLLHTILLIYTLSYLKNLKEQTDLKGKGKSKGKKKSS